MALCSQGLSLSKNFTEVYSQLSEYTAADRKKAQINKRQTVFKT